MPSFSRTKYEDSTCAAIFVPHFTGSCNCRTKHSNTNCTSCANIINSDQTSITSLALPSVSIRSSTIENVWLCYFWREVWYLKAQHHQWVRKFETIPFILTKSCFIETQCPEANIKDSLARQDWVITANQTSNSSQYSYMWGTIVDSICNQSTPKGLV